MEAGAYTITARVTDNRGATTTSAPVNILVEDECSASGIIKREYWDDVAGSRILDIPLTVPPSGIMTLTAFEAPSNLGRHYGARIRGYLCPPADGNYIFWIASNDHSELWISTDDNPINKRKIASVTGATRVRQWNKYRDQQSSPVWLSKGKRYYIEALHKQGVGTDNLAVGWQLADGTMERPIEGNRLSPFDSTTEFLSHIVYPSSGTKEVDPVVIKLEARRIIGAKRYTVELNTSANFEASSTVL